MARRRAPAPGSGTAAFSRQPPKETLQRPPPGAAVPVRAEPAPIAAAPRSSVLRSPRIYYLHPLLAGAIADWPRQFDRIARLGFDHVLLAPVFLPGGSDSMLLVADYDRLHPVLGEDEDAVAALARVAAAARARGLTLLLDVVPSRAVAHSPAAPPALFRISDEAAPLDPRH